MNIFVTSLSPVECAMALDDLRLNKMILETAQMLCSAYKRLFKEQNNILYKDAHINHPCSIWARKHINHYSWLVEHFKALHNEKLLRDHFQKKQQTIHQSWKRLSKILLSKQTFGFKENLSNYFFTFNCTEFKSEYNIILAYQKQMVKKWQNDLVKPKWTMRGKPSFYDLYT